MANVFMHSSRATALAMQHPKQGLIFHEAKESWFSKKKYFVGKQRGDKREERRTNIGEVKNMIQILIFLIAKEALDWTVAHLNVQRQQGMVLLSLIPSSVLTPPHPFPASPSSLYKKKKKRKKTNLSAALSLLQQMLDEKLIQFHPPSSSRAPTFQDDASQFTFVKDSEEDESIKKIKKGDVKIYEIAPAEIARQVSLSSILLIFFPFVSNTFLFSPSLLPFSFCRLH